MESQDVPEISGQPIKKREFVRPGIAKDGCHSQRTENLVGCFTHCAHLIAPLISALPLPHPTGVSRGYVYALYLGTPSARKQCGRSLIYSSPFLTSFIQRCYAAGLWPRR